MPLRMNSQYAQYFLMEDVNLEVREETLFQFSTIGQAMNILLWMVNV